MRKAYFMVAFLATIIQLGCEQGYPIQKNLSLSKYNGLWNFEVSGNESFVFREEQGRKVQYRLRFLCQSFHPSYFSFSDTIQFLIREPVLCYLSNPLNDWTQFCKFKYKIVRDEQSQKAMDYIGKNGNSKLLQTPWSCANFA